MNCSYIIKEKFYKSYGNFKENKLLWNDFDNDDWINLNCSDDLRSDNENLLCYIFCLLFD